MHDDVVYICVSSSDFHLPFHVDIDSPSLYQFFPLNFCFFLFTPEPNTFWFFILFLYFFMIFVSRNILVGVVVQVDRTILHRSFDFVHYD